MFHVEHVSLRVCISEKGSGCRWGDCFPVVMIILAVF